MVKEKRRKKQMICWLLFLGAMDFPLLSECFGNVLPLSRVPALASMTGASILSESKDAKDSNDFSDMRRPLHVRESLEQTGHKYYCHDCSIGFLKKRNYEQVPSSTFVLLLVMKILLRRQYFHSSIWQDEHIRVLSLSIPLCGQTMKMRVMWL